MTAYRIKKVLYFLFCCIAFPFLIYWFLYGLAYSFQGIESLLTVIGLWMWFSGDALQAPIFGSFIFLFPISIALFLFYRKECPLLLKLMLLFVGTVTSLTSSSVSGELLWSQFLPAAEIVLYKIILVFYALFALATLIWLIVSLVQYPKAPKKQSAA